MVGNFVNAIVRHLGDDDAGASRSGEIHIVHADSEARNDAALLHLADHVRIDFCVGDEQSVGIFCRRHNRLGRGLCRQTQLGPSPRNHRAGQVQVWKYGVCNCYE